MRVAAKLIDRLAADAVEMIREKDLSVIEAARQAYDLNGDLPSPSFSFDWFRQKVSNLHKKLSAEYMEQSTGSVPGEPEKIPAKKAKQKEAEPEAKPFVLSAWDFEGEGRMMGIDEYCERYNLPREDVLQYKLITHTGTPYYNTLFKDVAGVYSVISTEFIEETISKFIIPVSIPLPLERGSSADWFDRLIYADAHIGMDTDKDNTAMYSSPWNREVQLERAAVMVKEILANSRGTVLYVDELGDFMDGWDGLTTRGGHKLPQNMSNEQAFEVGIEFKMLLIDSLVQWYDEVHFHNICNDNHAGAFGYTVNYAAKKICEAKYGTDRVTITNQRQFINNYIVGKHAFVNTHGKDSKALKFGFKPKLDAVQIEKIDAYLKYNKIYQKADFIEFGKGDSHQMLLDYCTSDDFDYFNYPAFSPASEWVQTNFKESRSGFVIQNVMYNENVKCVTPKWFGKTH